MRKFKSSFNLQKNISTFRYLFYININGVSFLSKDKEETEKLERNGQSNSEGYNNLVG